MPKGPGFWLTFLYYFSTTTLIVAFLTSYEMGTVLPTPFAFRMGILGGLLVGVVGGYFNHSVSISVAFKNKQIFVKQLNHALAQMGFEQKPQIEDFIVYQKLGWQSWFAGNLFVKIEKKSAIIVGRAGTIKQLEQKI